MREYTLISADSHVVEPPDLWTSRLPARLRERAPHQQRMPEGDAWVIEGVAQPFPFGLIQCGGLPPEEYRLWVRWEDVRAEAREPLARLGAMDAAGVDAEVLYPSPRIQNAIAMNPDAEFQIACVRAYNDWLSEFCETAPERLAGLAMLPSAGVKSAVDELERALELPAMRGVLLSRYPTLGTDLDEEDDALFHRCAERGIPVNIHVGISGSPSGTPAKALGSFGRAFTGAFRFYDPPVLIAEMIYTQLLDRVPGLRVVFAEVDAGWVPYLREQLDDRFARQNPADRVALELLPGEYFDRNLMYTLVKDRYGIRNRHEIGPERMMWSSDFPHASCDHPHFDRAIREDFEGVPVDELQVMLAGAARQLYFAGA